MFLLVVRIGSLWNRSPSLSKKHAHCCTDTREEMVRRRRKRTECERKNNHREDKAVSVKKFHCEGAS